MCLNYAKLQKIILGRTYLSWPACILFQLYEWGLLYAISNDNKFIEAHDQQPLNESLPISVTISVNLSFEDTRKEQERPRKITNLTTLKLQPTNIYILLPCTTK